jgi:type IV pilus assembly protein PilO
MKLSFASLHNMPMRKQAVIIVVGVSVFIIVFYFLLCKPKAMATYALQSQLQQQRMVLQNVQRELRDMPDPASYYLQLQEQEARVKSWLPDSDAIPDLLVTLNTLGKEQNVKINSIKQGAFVDRKAYYEIPLEMTVTGNYPDILQFINKMENLRRFNSITKMGVHPEETFLSMQLSTVVYVYGPIPQNVQPKSK